MGGKLLIFSFLPSFCFLIWKSLNQSLTKTEDTLSFDKEQKHRQKYKRLCLHLDHVPLLFISEESPENLLGLVPVTTEFGSELWSHVCDKNAGGRLSANRS